MDSKATCVMICGNLYLDKIKFNICINAHLHRFSYHPKGSQECKYPIFIGGGNQLKDTTVIILQKKGKGLNIKILNAKGKTLLDITE